MQYRRQKRWWNGYLLFYERVDSPFTGSRISVFSRRTTNLFFAEAVNSDAGKLPVLAGAIERGIQKENLEFMHLKALFSIENFRFMRSLVDSVAPLTVVEPMVTESLTQSNIDFSITIGFLAEGNAGEIGHARFKALDEFLAFLRPSNEKGDTRIGRRMGQQSPVVAQVQ